MRSLILKDFPGAVDFRPNDNSYLFSQMTSFLQDNPEVSLLIGALHGDLVGLYEGNRLRPLNDIYDSLGNRSFIPSLLSLGRFDGGDVYYIPWMQASFVMAASKKALAYLPEGARLDELTYDQLLAWGRSIYEKTGKRAIGFPAGEKGLMHRFFQGYLYPSFTASTLLKFRSRDAAAMWEYFRELWSFAQPRSLVYSTMAEPLLSGDVWIAWDHTARLVKAFEERGEEFVAFPAPIGPKGRGFMPVSSGLAIPAAVRNPRDAALLIDYLTRPEVQAKTLRETGFFPVIDLPEDSPLPPYLREIGSAVSKQSLSEKSIPTLLPIGLGEHGGDYNSLFMLTFSEIVLEGKDVLEVLSSNVVELQKIIDAEDAKCWLPDVSERRPCRIE